MRKYSTNLVKSYFLGEYNNNYEVITKILFATVQWILHFLNLPVEVLSESTTHAVESDGIDAAVGESEAET